MERVESMSRRRMIGMASLATASAAMHAGASRLLAAEAADATPRGLPDVVIDTHTHFYDPSRREGVPWPAPGDATLYRTVIPDEWQRLVRPLGVKGTVVVEASSWVEDNQWLLDLATRHESARLPGMLGVVGVVGNLPLGEDGCGSLITRFARDPRYRGVRVNGDRLREGLEDAAYRRDLGSLADKDLAIDVNHGAVFEAVEKLAPAFASLRIVIDHMGGGRFTDSGPEPGWIDAIGRAARHTNVFLKVSAMVELAAHAAGTPAGPTQPDFYEPWLEVVWKAFGPKRLMFGSNWPVSDRAGTYADIMAVVRPFIGGKGPEAAKWFFGETSRQAYRWITPA